MGETRRKFDQDFKEGAVRLVRETGKPIAQVARNLSPVTIASWAAVFSAASTARITHTTTGAALLLAGIGLGTATWFTVLSTAMALVRRLTGPRVHQAITVLSGLGLIAFGITLAWQTVAAAPP
jgi:threonine/homoserine/homoserine lactone efflux protein